MDTSEYLPLFLAECRENLEELTNSIVRLEEDPADQETLDAVFRVAHSLKGMSGTMGFEGMAKLTHQMEDVLELVRQRGSGLPHDAVDVLLACLDGLNEAVESIAADGEEKLDPRELITRLSVLVRDRDEPRAAAAPPVTAAPPAGGVRVTLGPGTLMPAVRAFQVLTVIAEHSEVRSSSPSQEDVDFFTGNEVVADVVCDDPDELALAIRRVTDVADVVVADTSPPEQASAEAGPELEVLTPKPAEPKKPKGDRATRTAPTVRIDAERLDQLMHLVGDAASKRTRVEALIAGLEIPELRQAMEELKGAARELQQMVQRVRMIPIETVFMRFPRLVRDVASKLDKEVELTLEGQETELDRTVVDAIGDPLVHLIRNALDHGIEGPEERVAAGKPATAKLTISARHAGGAIAISVTDDGRGIDPAVVARRAVERGLIGVHEADQIDSEAAIELLFTPGFSTATAVDDLSGRGVGMDAVRNRVRKLGGEVFVNSVRGQGTSAELRLPLTLAIMPALLVRVAGSAYAFQLARVERTLLLADQTVRFAAGAPVLMLEEESVPLIRAVDVFEHGETDVADTHVIILSGRDGSMALAVSELMGQHELVTRALPPALAGSGVLSGAAVLPNSEIVLIADCDSLQPGSAKGPGVTAEAA